MWKRNYFAGLVFCLFSTGTIAGEVDVLDVSVSKRGNDQFHFNVTVKHADTGWDHYADGWDILDSEGNVLGHRTLYHPHVNEQPFTRSLGGVKIPPGVKRVKVRAHDSVHGHGGEIFEVDLPR